MAPNDNDDDDQDDGLLTTASYSNNGISATTSAATTPEVRLSHNDPGWMMIMFVVHHHKVKLKFAPPSKSPVLPPRVALKPPSGPAPTNYSAGGWRQEEMVPKVPTVIISLYHHTSIPYLCSDQGIPTSSAAQQIQESGALSQANLETIQHKSYPHSISISLTITEANLEAILL